MEKINGVEVLAKLKAEGRHAIFIGQYSYGKGGNGAELVVGRYDGISNEWYSGHYFKAEQRVEAIQKFADLVAGETDTLVGDAKRYYGPATREAIANG